MDKILAKGKAKARELRNQAQTSWQSQSHVSQHYPSQQHLQGPYYYQQQTSPVPQYQQQQPFGPPIPYTSKPYSPAQAPPVPSGRPTNIQPSTLEQQHKVSVPIVENIPNPREDTVYWKPSFDGDTPITHNFGHEIGDHGWGNGEKQMYTSSPLNSFHFNNQLVVRGLVQNGSYTSARLTSHQTLSRPRGYLTATVSAPVAEGIWSAYWLLPIEPFSWPTDGEVDILESWHGSPVNHSCLHWGHHNGEDWDKHRVKKLSLNDMACRPHTFGFAWSEEEGIPDWRGRLIWYVDGNPIMKSSIPLCIRRMEDFRILINMAMGGSVCQGNLPKDGNYDLIISELKMCGEPPAGWESFEHAWSTAPEGKPV